MSETKILENNLECLACDCYYYCTMDTCILDVDDDLDERDDFWDD